MKKNKKIIEFRTRNYASVVYEESAPKNWIEIIKNQFVSSFVSPLHNSDVNPTGEVKKPHYHVIFMFDSLKTREQAKELFDKFGGVGLEIVQSIRGYARYLCHLDAPEKAAYNPSDVLCFGGADYYSVINLVTDKYKILKEVQRFCIDNNLFSFSDLMDFCAENRSDWYRILADNTIFIREYLKSRRWTFEQKSFKK